MTIKLDAAALDNARVSNGYRLTFEMTHSDTGIKVNKGWVGIQNPSRLVVTYQR